jgi:hypothetical protein
VMFITWMPGLSHSSRLRWSDACARIRLRAHAPLSTRVESPSRPAPLTFSPPSAPSPQAPAQPARFAGTTCSRAKPCALGH